MRIIIFFLILAVAGCDKTPDPSQVSAPVVLGVDNDSALTPGDHVIFGRYCGMCIGECLTMYLVTDEGLYIDRSGKYFVSNDMKAFEGSRVRGAAFEKARDLVAAIPHELYTMMKDERTIGCPDCTDQCGIYLEINSNERTRTIFIDPEVKGESEEMLTFINEVMEIIEVINRKE